MAEVRAQIKKQHYRTEIKSPDGNTIIADESVNNGGNNEGMSPEELLAASLAACTSITLRMYADRKKYLLNSVEVNISVKRDNDLNFTEINREILLHGTLADDERNRLLEIANKCPVHKILSNQITIKTTIQ